MLLGSTGRIESFYSMLSHDLSKNLPRTSSRELDWDLVRVATPGASFVEREPELVSVLERMRDRVRAFRLNLGYSFLDF